MAEEFEISAEVRDDQGKGASRRLRRAGRLPGVVYGAGKDSVAITMEHNDLWVHLQKEAFHSHVLTLNIGGKPEQVILRDVQWHPYKVLVMHLDLQRISATKKIHMKIPLHFVGEDVSPALKFGGVMSHLVTEVEIECLPKNLPEYIEVDVSAMELEQILHYSDIKLPSGVELLVHGQEGDPPIAAIHAAKVVVESAEEGGTDTEAAADSEGKK